MADVMVVEDDSDLREAICDMLDINDMSYMEAENGQQAQKILKDNKVNLVLSDVQMSPGNGYQLLEFMHENHPAIPVILMTAYGSIPQAVDAIQAGAVDYLVKPFEVTELVETLQKHLLPGLRYRIRLKKSPLTARRLVKKTKSQQRTLSQKCHFSRLEKWPNKFVRKLLGNALLK